MLNIGFHPGICKMRRRKLDRAEPLFTCVPQTPSALGHD